MEITPLSGATGNRNIILASSLLTGPEKTSIVLSPSFVEANSVKICLSPAVKEIQEKIKKQDTFYQTLTSYSLPSLASLVSADNIPVKGFNTHLPEIVTPAIKEARDKALSKINSLLTKVNEIKESLRNPEEEEIICPYEQTKRQYLGPNYTPPSIASLSYPEDFSLEKALPATVAINASCYNIMLSHLHAMSSQAMDTGFPGMTAEHMGNGFAVLSSTSEGNKFVLDEKRLKDHLEFAEIVKSIPMQEIIDNPKEIAFKLIHRFIEINSGLDISKDLPFSMAPITIPSLEPIPQPQLEPQQVPRVNPLPIDRPELQYIAQPSFFAPKQNIESQPLRQL
jgi:hypothetical protein